MVVGPDGKPHNIRVVRTLGLGLDEKAIEAVKNWRFEPAMKDGKPVAVQIDVDVNFNLHEKELNTRILALEEKVNAGDPKAELELSSSYFAGRDVPQNEVRGLELLESPEPRPCRGELRGETCFAQPAGRRVVELGWQVMVVGCLVPLCPLESMTSVAAKNCLVASRPEKGQARPRQ